MRRISMVTWLAVVLGTLGVTSAAETSNPTGTWRLKTDFGGRSFISMLKLQWDGEKLTGVLLRSEGRETPLEDARFEDGAISFKTTRVRGERRFVTTYQGTLGQDTITGRTEFRRGDESRVWKWEAERADHIDLARRDEAPPVEADIVLNDENYEVWRDHILPADDELAWQQIPWLSTFKDGVLAANAAGKPLLLWTMNGHPLGCT